jgi:hypothetical protein
MVVPRAVPALTQLGELLPGDAVEVLLKRLMGR